MLLKELRGLAPILAVCAGLSALFVYIAGTGLADGVKVSHRDLIEYWAAFRLLDENPYDPARIFQIQNSAGAGFADPLMMWNPPWLPLLMPGINLPFNQAWLVWKLVNVTCWFMSGVVLMASCRAGRRQSTAPAVIFAAFSAPALLNLEMGQMGSFLTLGAALVIYGWSVGGALTFGLGALLLSVKPHIFLPLAAFFAVRVVVERRWRFAAVATLPTAVTVAFTCFRYPEAVPAWIAALITTPEGAIDPRRWMTPTIGRWGDILMIWGGLSVGTLISKAILLAGILGGGWVAVRKHASCGGVEPALTALMISVISSPFSWTFDQMVLVLPQVFVLATVWRESESIVQRWIALLGFIAINMVMLVQWLVFGADLQFYFWYPVIQVLVCILVCRLFVRTGDSAEALNPRCLSTTER